MRSNAKSIEEYINALPEDRREVIQNLRKIILDNLPEGFKETISYGMIGYVVPHSIYPAGYHCTPELPLPFINLASQKNHIGFYHMGIYSDEKLLKWFTQSFEKLKLGKLDMGKSCIRFKNINKIPFNLIGELVAKIDVNQWIETYESKIKN